MATMMKCRHSANATCQGRPCCAICAGFTPDAEIVVEAPILDGRKAKCGCGKTVPSSTDLAFFRHYPNAAYDTYYCGCAGWN
jgi:hypothetical protein